MDLQFAEQCNRSIFKNYYLLKFVCDDNSERIYLITNYHSQDSKTAVENLLNLLAHELVNILDIRRIRRKARSMALIAPSIASLRIVLASASKQRLMLLKQMGIEPIVRISNCDENLSKELPADKYVCETALIKATTIAKFMNSKDYDVIIGCDTVVVFHNEIIDNNHQCEQFVERTVVKFCQIPESVIEKYVASDEPFDRAGSYGIQAYGGIFVEKIDGCYYNVVGLPINRLMKALWRRVGLK
ncbi:Maf-like protein [Dirofilaria immitis]|nr:Maf-like protein [Dirofilaria immitis]